MYPCERTDINNLSVLIHPLVTTLKLQSNGPSHTNTVTGTLAVTFGTASRGLGGAAACPGPSSLYQMQQPTHQHPVYRLRFIRCGTITASGVWRVNITGLHYSVIIGGFLQNHTVLSEVDVILCIQFYLIQHWFIVITAQCLHVSLFLDTLYLHHQIPSNCSVRHWTICVPFQQFLSHQPLSWIGNKLHCASKMPTFHFWKTSFKNEPI